MKIVSDFRDYYDNVMGYGVDYDTVWLREVRPVKEKYKRFFFKAGWRFDKHTPYTKFRGTWGSADKIPLNYRWFDVGFCGKLYTGIEVATCSDRYGKIKESKICYKIEQIDSFIEENFKKKEIDEYYGVETSKYAWRSYLNSVNTIDPRIWRASPKRIYFEKWFERAKERQSKCTDEIFIDNNTPIIVGGKANVRLDDYEFYRVVDPYTAFQGIQMFFGKLRSPEKPIPEVSDADMLEAKGFDPKWSFRKEPGKKRKRGKKK